MDEPLASLDAARKAETLPYIERLRDELSIPIVYVSHSLPEIERLARRHSRCGSRPGGGFECPGHSAGLAPGRGDREQVARAPPGRRFGPGARTQRATVPQAAGAAEAVETALRGRASRLT